MKKLLIGFLIVILIGVAAMSIFSPRSNSSPYASQQNVLADLSGWYEDAPDRTWTFVSANAGGNMFTVYVSGDVTGIFRIPMRVRAKQGGDYQYFIIHSVSAYDSGNDRTTLLLFGGTDYELSSGTITDVAFSKERFPAGFPLDKNVYSIEVVDNSQRTQSSPSGGTWYNIGTTNSQITLPIGIWDVSYKAQCSSQIGSASQLDFRVTLSTTNNSESNTHLTTLYENSSNTILIQSFTLSADDTIVAVLETTYYLNAKTSVSATQISFGGSIPTIIRAVSAYY